MEQPLLVRGCSIVANDDLQAQKMIVARALPGWNGVDGSAITVEDVSGAGGSKTFKVSAEGCDPPVVALHSRVQSGSDSLDIASENRAAAASLAFSKAGVGPRRLAQGGDWYIEVWGREQPWNGGKVSDEYLKQFAQLLARVHQDVPTEWYDEHRCKIIEQNPGFAYAPTGSHAWATACRLRKFENQKIDPEHLAAATRFYVQAGTPPKHPLAARIVTSHGDFHPGNLIWTAQDGNSCIDLEFAHVGHAGNDLAYFISGLRCHEPSACLTFLEQYLSSSGYDSTPEDIMALSTDVHLASLIVFYRSLLWKEFERGRDDVMYNFDVWRNVVVPFMARPPAPDHSGMLVACILFLSTPSGLYTRNDVSEFQERLTTGRGVIRSLCFVPPGDPDSCVFQGLRDAEHGAVVLTLASHKGLGLVLAPDTGVSHTVFEQLEVVSFDGATVPEHPPGRTLDLPLHNEPFTISVWVRTTCAQQEEMAIVAWGEPNENNYTLLLIRDDMAVGSCFWDGREFGGDLDSAPQPDLFGGAWHHLAVTSRRLPVTTRAAIWT